MAPKVRFQSTKLLLRTSELSDATPRRTALLGNLPPFFPEAPLRLLTPFPLLFLRMAFLERESGREAFLLRHFLESLSADLFFPRRFPPSPWKMKMPAGVYQEGRVKKRKIFQVFVPLFRGCCFPSFPFRYSCWLINADTEGKVFFVPSFTTLRGGSASNAEIRRKVETLWINVHRCIKVHSYAFSARLRGRRTINFAFRQTKKRNLLSFSLLPSPCDVWMLSFFLRSLLLPLGPPSSPPFPLCCAPFLWKGSILAHIGRTRVSPFS